jgi:Rrf2 family protein
MIVTAPPLVARAPAHPYDSPEVKLSKRTEYGLRAVVQLALAEPRTFVQVKDLAKDEGLPKKWLEAILLALKRAHFLESKVGSGGGYRLSRPPREIRVGAVIRRLEGRLNTRQPIPAQELSPGEVATHLINERLTEATDEVLDDMTLEQLVEQVSRTSSTHQEMYYI